MLRSPRLEDHMNTIGIDQSLSNRYYFEQKFVVIKGMLQSPRLEDHMNTIGIDQSL